MIVTPHEYLDLTDQLTFLQLKATTLEAHNQKLTQELIAKNEVIRSLTERLEN